MQKQTGQAGSTRHDEQTKLRALAHFASSGSLSATADATGLAKSTLFEWTKDEEGIEHVAHIRTALRHAIAADLVANARLAVAEVRDRLINGDEVIQSDGSVVRRKISGKDAMYIASNSISQHSMLTMDSKAVANANLRGLAADLIAALKSADAASNAKTIDGAHTVEAEPQGERQERRVGEGG